MMNQQQLTAALLGVQTSLKAAWNAIDGGGAATIGTAYPEKVKRAREASGLSRTAFAASVGTTTHTLRCWETGKSQPRGLAVKAGLERLFARL